MNALALSLTPENDYRAAMQQAAVAYLFRRRDQHLAGDQQMLENCTRYLSQSLEVPEHLVNRIAELAVAEFEGMTSKRLMLLGFWPSSRVLRPQLMLLDTHTQQRCSVSARFLPKRLLPYLNTSR